MRRPCTHEDLRAISIRLVGAVGVPSSHRSRICTVKAYPRIHTNICTFSLPLFLSSLYKNNHRSSSRRRWSSESTRCASSRRARPAATTGEKPRVSRRTWRARSGCRESQGAMGLFDFSGVGMCMHCLFYMPISPRQLLGERSRVSRRTWRAPSGCRELQWGPWACCTFSLDGDVYGLSIVYAAFALSVASYGGCVLGRGKRSWAGRSTVKTTTSRAMCKLVGLFLYMSCICGG